MKNKVLVKIFVPQLEKDYDVFLPVNEVIWKELLLIYKSICDLNGIEFNSEDTVILLNKCTGTLYDGNTVLLNSDIKNATELILLSNNLSI